MERGAPVGLWFVAASQVAYVIGGFALGAPDLGTGASLLSAIAAGVGASALARGDRATFAWAFVGFASVQGVDYVTSLRDPNAFFVGFTILLAGLIVAAVSALRWRREPVDAPRPHGVRFGAGLCTLGSLTYLVANFLAGFRPNAFLFGVLAAGIGWALVALA